MSVGRGAWGASGLATKPTRARRRLAFADAEVLTPILNRLPMPHLQLTIEGMTCEHCVRAVRNRLEHTAGVKVTEVQVGLAALDYDPARATIDDIEEAIADEGYTAFVVE